MAEQATPETYEDYGYDNKMMKSDQMTADGYRALFREIMGGN